MQLSRGALSLAVLLAGVALCATPAISQTGSSDRDRVALTVGPVRVEFAADGQLTDTVSAFVRGGIPGKITARMFDAVVGAPGKGWERVAYGSTTNTLEGFVEFSPESYDYIPNGEQEFTWELTADPAGGDRPRWGEFVITIEPDVEPGPTEAVVNAAAAIQVVAFGDASETDLRLELSGLRVEQRRPWTVVDRLLPDIHRVIGHGPANLIATGRNSGDAFLDERTIFEIRRVSPLTLLPGFSGSLPGPVLRVSMRPRYTLPGQTFSDSTTSIIPLDNGTQVDALPFIGFVRVTAIATGRLGDIEAEPATISKTILVFPWSEFLFFFVVYLAQREWRHRKGRKVNTTDAPPPPTLRTRVRGAIRRVVPSFGRARSGGGSAPEGVPPTDAADPGELDR